MSHALSQACGNVEQGLVQILEQRFFVSTAVQQMLSARKQTQTSSSCRALLG